MVQVGPIAATTRGILPMKCIDENQELVSGFRNFLLGQRRGNLAELLEQKDGPGKEKISNGS
jgi:hypothetical protein